MPLFSRGRRKAPAAAAVERPPLPAPVPQRALIAAATRLTNDFGYRKSVIRRASWQTEAWRQYDLNGELRYAVEWMANSMSRIRLVVADVDDGRVVPGWTANQAVLTLVEGLLGDATAVTQLLHCMGQNLGVAGDFYLVEFGDEWLVLSTEQIWDASDGNVQIEYELEKYLVNTATNIVLRIHRPHPRRYTEANSPARGALPILRTIEQLSKYRDATINSRLAGAGILGIASELSFARAPEDNSDGDPFMDSLAESMLTPISDQGDPSAVVPNVVRGPKEYLPTQANWLVSPAADLTTVTSDLEDKAIIRLATALDIPAEVLTGTGNASRWATWQTEETAIKVHVEPLIILICAALTEGYLEPLLEQAGLDADKFAVWFDASQLIQRPNRSADAKDLYDKGLLSKEATRRENGFVEEDAPQGQEKCEAVMLEVLRLSPRFADDHLDVVAKILNWEACGIDPNTIVDKPAPGIPADQAPDAGGTPRNGNPAQPNVQPNALPGNGAPNGG